jgi:tRNA(fMet)-specific endonuclease VapC
MLEFMLDTDTVSFALRGLGGVAEQLASKKPAEVCISAITLAELRAGVELRGSRRLESLVHAFASGITVLAFDDRAAASFAKVAAALTRRGAPIGQLDTLIAAHALSAGLTLVSGNARHFSRVRGLRIENWK